MSERERVCFLVKQAQEGDNEAMGQLFALYKDRCYFVAFKILKEHQGAEDVVQETAILVAQNLQALRKPEKFLSWAMRISNNLALHKVGRRRELPLTPPEREEAAVAEPADPDAGPQETLDKRETSRILTGLVDELPQEQRFCVYMFYYEELTVAQIAQTLRVSENTVKSRLRYAREKLRAGVQDVERQGVRLHIFPIPFFWVLRGALRDSAGRFTLSPDKSEAILRGALEASAAAGGAATVAGGEALAAAALASGGHALLAGAGLSAAAKAGIAAAAAVSLGGLAVSQIVAAGAPPAAQAGALAPSSSCSAPASPAPQGAAGTAIQAGGKAAGATPSPKPSPKPTSSPKPSPSPKPTPATSASPAPDATAKYFCTECGAGRQYPNQSCPVCGAHQEGDPNIHHYHGDGYNSGVCPSCGLEYHAVTQEELDRGVVPGSTLSEENGYAPDGSLLPGWVMSDIWGHPVPEEEYVPEPTTYNDGCPLGQHLHSGNCNDRYTDGCWGSGHTYTGSCMFAPTPTPEVAEPTPEVTEPTPEVTEPAPEAAEPAPEAEAAPASEVASAPQA